MKNGKSKIIPVLKYAGAFCITVALSVFLLMLAACLPQKSIDVHVRESAEIMVAEGCYPRISDLTYGSRLDNWTDAIMLMESKATSRQRIDSVLSNHMFSYGGPTPVDDLLEYAKDENPTPSSYYTRYWMGYRSILRLMLFFVNYYQLKRYLAFVFFVLFAALIGSITKSINQRAGVLFAISILLVRPYIICNSLQFSCCFLIAFAAMLMIPWVSRHPKHECLFFMEVGMVTMYFDFYTTPIITFGLPMVYLYLLRAAGGEKISFRQLLKNALIWFGAYVLMWFAKMLLTMLFTPENALQNGLQALFGWMGLNGWTRKDAQYNPILALLRVAVPIVSDRAGAVILLSAVVLLVSVLIYGFYTGKIDRGACSRNRGLFVMAAMPFVWFLATAEPTTVHFWFQYRSVALTYWAIGAYLCLAWKPSSKRDVLLQ